MKKCIYSFSSTIIINGMHAGNLTPTRGIRQGGPLSRIFFFLSALNAYRVLLERAELEGKLSGIRIGKNAPTISHLIFVDDTILFRRASTVEISYLMELVLKYESMSGKKSILINHPYFGHLHLKIQQDGLQSKF